ncbi:MAG: hypothetical protein MUO31_04130 [Thermodesulfovibrionales bacterium]|jgi:hypothetical protein|nr:hypothetical protein [Thermodesulfovibrionales bacterium]
MVELGQIQRPLADEFSGKRKLYCVANIYPVEEAENYYHELVRKYWDEVAQQIEKVEAAGKVQKIFCEIIYQQGDEALNILGTINERMLQIIKKKLEEGSTLVPLENKEILGPYTDWSNCLRVVFTKEVFSKIVEFYKEFSEKRLQHFMSVIDSNLAEAEAGLLFMKDEDRSKLQFPKDIEVFLITPPSYDDIIRWFREKLVSKSKE